MHKAVIVGTGPAGLTAAIYLARANMDPLVIEGPEPGGQLTLTTDVENFPGFPDGVLGPELMENMKKQALRFGATIERGWVKDIDFSERPFKLTTDTLGDIMAESVLISTGASAKLLGIPGESENMGRGVSTCATCDGFFFRGKKIVVIGGGDSAMEEATFLTKFASEVTILHRRKDLRASKIMQERARANEKISWKLNASPIEVVAENNKVIGIKVKDSDSGKEEIVNTDGIFVAIGHRPNTDFLQGKLNMDDKGYIQVEPGTTRTNVAGVFACGDVQDFTYRQAITAAGTGCMAAMDCERFLEGNAFIDWSM
ncbi:thioredoxin-disulfide reductase [Bacillus sp. N1-1]|jgi:thioredoxin reductase (NADPH)|uniref:thioredoxin-disulfide reductase n=1 Tax=Bacillus sp. N1-1 TaxID=2682541 RepID=UPI00131739F6|nr:thioredoxin-disulfide reductase [Bacillus sp. N1-1]QHA91945.1 thioredoxin-disulfide reductase [Bacillus sp. N1-1]